jgi:hypothetical protein
LNVELGDAQVPHFGLTADLAEEPVAALQEAVDQETARLVLEHTPGRLYRFGD